MFMSQEEIVSRYNRADNKLAHIQILADLNATDKKTIRTILSSAGIELPVPTKRGGSRPKFDDEIAPLVAAGMTDVSIAEKVGCSTKTVSYFRERKNKAKTATSG